MFWCLFLVFYSCTFSQETVRVGLIDLQTAYQAHDWYKQYDASFRRFKTKKAALLPDQRNQLLLRVAQLSQSFNRDRQNLKLKILKNQQLIDQLIANQAQIGLESILDQLSNLNSIRTKVDLQINSLMDAYELKLDSLLTPYFYGFQDSAAILDNLHRDLRVRIETQRIQNKLSFVISTKFPQIDLSFFQSNKSIPHPLSNPSSNSSQITRFLKNHQSLQNPPDLFDNGYDLTREILKSLRSNPVGEIKL